MLEIPKAKGRISSKSYTDFIRTLRCCVCDYRAPSDPSHVVSRGRAEGHDTNCIPLCWLHHTEQHTRFKGMLPFVERHGLNLQRIIELLHLAYEDEHRVQRASGESFEAFMLSTNRATRGSSKRKNHKPISKHCNTNG